MVPENATLASESIERVHLRSDPFPEVKLMTIVRVTIGPGGQIHKRPKKFFASQKGRDIVTWAFKNASNEPITVTVGDFLRRADCSDDEGTVPVIPFHWLTSDTVTVGARGEEFIDGRVDPDYGRLNAEDDDCLSYSIKVVSSTGTIDYDPDGDIKP